MADLDLWDGGFRDEIQCPHCNAVDYEFTDYPRGLNHDGDEAHTSCWACGKDMIATVSVSYSFATRALSPPPTPPGDPGRKE